MWTSEIMPSEYYKQYSTGKTDSIIKEAQQKIDALSPLSNEHIDRFFLFLTAQLSEQNIDKTGTGDTSFTNIEGGPFAAVIVRYEYGFDDAGQGRGKPIILGVGTNHVIPEKDPSTHAEIAAIRDATARIGFSDLSNTVMFSSCECCPQCLASVSSVGIRHVIFANDRFQATKIGFSDEEQYRYLNTIDNNNRHSAPVFENIIPRQ